SFVIAQRATEKKVIPCGNMQGGNVDISVMIFDRNGLPVIVVAGVRQPIEIVRRERGARSRMRMLIKIEQWIVGEREGRDSLQCICIVGDLAIESILREA